jgi:nucleoside-diphosphate-sugar epimerase
MVLLTGATGFTGQRLLPRLKEKTRSVRVFVRPTSDLAAVDLRDLDVVVGDLTDREAVRTALSGVQRVLHLAHIRYTPQLLEAAPPALEHVVALSSLRLLSTVPSPSVDEVARAEQEVRAFETPCTILRPSMIFGPDDRNINHLAIQLKRFRWVPVFGNGRALSQPVYVDDVVTAALASLERPVTAGKSYALAGPTPLSLNDIVAALGRVLDVHPRKVRIPVGMALAGLRCLSLLGVNAPVTAEQVRRSQEDKVFSIEEARSDLGFDPIGFDEALARIYSS